ncbi:sensor histidine kinase [Edaphobacter aggregans]|uniref:sensor histidine kinase n=1 Tax=Edaphobacter aggregans TaxID=570835 RepID=UPI00068B6FAA|nr:two-component regulator propeller domain-containing protein [Edaphobacter aggregans]
MRRYAKSNSLCYRQLLSPVVGFAVSLALTHAGAQPVPQRTAQAQWQDRQTGSGPIDNGIRVLRQDSQGALWVATANGVERVANGNLEVLLVGGISADIVAPFAEDGAGGMFFVTSSGLFHWQKGTASKLPLYLPEGDNVVAVYCDPKHRIWIGTTTGVFELVPRKGGVPAGTPEYDAVPRAAVRSAVSALFADATGDLWIGTRHDGLWRLGPDGLSRWPSQDGLATGTTSVAPSNAADETPSSSIESANHQRPFYQTWYFYLGLAVTVIAFAAYLFRRHIQLMTGRLGIILEERNRIASECHDTLMAGFAAISWQLEATAKLFRDSGSDSTPAAKSCELARSMVAHCQAEARRIIWDLRDTNEVTNVLSEALSRTLSSNHLQGAIDTTLDVEGEEVRLAPGCVHHLVCIGQEAVSNAIRHAECSRIVVRLKYDSDSLSLSIRDDGHGFLPSDRSASLRGHFGIPVMEERSRKLGGSFRIQTSAGLGTEVTVKVAFDAMQQPVNQQHHVIRWIGI